MAMPRGHKMNQGYATVKDGLDYRAISEIMSERGFKMNHATARNVLLLQPIYWFHEERIPTLRNQIG
jgi:murein endopeptidase